LAPRNNTWALVFVLTGSWVPERTRTPDHNPQEKPQTPNKMRLYLIFFLSLPDTLSAPALSVYLQQTAFTSCWLTFDFCPAHGQGPSWLVLREPLSVLGSGLLASLVYIKLKEDINSSTLAMGWRKDEIFN